MESNDKDRTHEFNSVNQYFQNIQNYDVVNDVNSALAVDLSSLNHNDDFHIDPSIAGSGRDVAASALHLQREDLPEGFDPKRVCRFCGKTFSHVGSLGRHLDQKKGTDGHPADQIDMLRSDVRRRGDPESVRQRRLMRAQRYNRREDVKERNRLRRRKKSKEYRARDLAVRDFMAQLNTPSLSQHPSFPRMVLFFLPPSLWPHDPPTLETFKTVNSWIQDEALEAKLKNAYDNWTTLSGDAKHEMWIREQRICAQEALGSLTLFQLADRENWIAKLAAKKLEIINSNKSDSEDEYREQDATSEALAAVAAAVADQASRLETRD